MPTCAICKYALPPDAKHVVINVREKFFEIDGKRTLRVDYEDGYAVGEFADAVMVVRMKSRAPDVVDDSAVGFAECAPYLHQWMTHEIIEHLSEHFPQPKAN